MMSSMVLVINILFVKNFKIKKISRKLLFIYLIQMPLGRIKNLTFTVRALAANFTVIASVIVYEVERSTQKYVEKVNFFPLINQNRKNGRVEFGCKSNCSAWFSKHPIQTGCTSIIFQKW